MNKFIRDFWPTLSFGVIYPVNLYFYVKLGNSYPSYWIYTILTSWFNPSEDYIFHPFVAGFEVNYVFPILFMFLFSVYSRGFQTKKSSEYISIGTVFALGISSTIIVSGLEGAYSKIIGTGSSILAFTFVVSFTLILLFDLFYDLKKDGLKVIAEKKLNKTLIFLIVKTSLRGGLAYFSVFIFHFYYNNLNHFYGLGVFSIITTMSIIGKWQMKKAVLRNMVQ